VDESDVKSGRIELVVRLVHHLVIVVEKHEKRHLVQDQLLPQAHIQVIRFDVAKHCEA